MKRMTFDTGKECVLVSLTPPVAGQPWGLVDDLEFFVLANRHEGEHLFPISEFPCFVHIARLLDENVKHGDTVSANDLQTVAWGELYRTREDAENHAFDSK